jgi:hypothetical protein
MVTAEALTYETKRIIKLLYAKNNNIQDSRKRNSLIGLSEHSQGEYYGSLHCE